MRGFAVIRCKLAFLCAAAVGSVACAGDGVRAADIGSGGAGVPGASAAGGDGKGGAGNGGNATNSTGGASSGGRSAVANGGAVIDGSSVGGSARDASGTGGAPGAGGTAATGGASGVTDAGSGGATNHGVDFSGIVSEYRTWHPQTAEPVDISSYVFGLCRLPTLKEQAFVDSEHGARRLQDWANDATLAGIAGDAGSHVFVEGAAIVKEKYILNTKGVVELVARGFMIKREAGFDPARGDWDYAYWESGLGILHTTEQSQYCGGCHIGGGSTDSVFIDGLRP